jgi:High-temperature-induced dauer-formation protein
MRVLTRLFPFLLEADELHDWQSAFWWTKRRKRPRGLVQGALKIRPSEEVAAPENEDEVLFEGSGDIPLVETPAAREMERSAPLAEELMDTVLDLLSFAGFGVPASIAQNAESKVTLAIWYCLKWGGVLIVGKRGWDVIRLLARQRPSSRIRLKHYDFSSL